MLVFFFSTHTAKGGNCEELSINKLLTLSQIYVKSQCLFFNLSLFNVSLIDLLQIIQLKGDKHGWEFYMNISQRHLFLF